MLRQIGFLNSYRSDRNNIAKDFLSPALANARYYDRAVGYFSSGVLRHVAEGLVPFVRSSGYMRLIASPELSQADVDAIALGYLSRETAIYKHLETVVDELEQEPAVFGIRVLTWLVAQNRLEIRIAYSKQPGKFGIYHEKIGIFRDQYDEVAFSGSLNETGAAVGGNFESIDVFTSWTDGPRVREKVSDFERLWANQTPSVEVISFPQALLRRVTGLAPVDPPEAGSVEESAIRLKLWPFQDQAVKVWTENGYQGILQMATGTGKTITAIKAAVDSAAAGVRSIVILAPLKHLVEQWAAELRMKTAFDTVVCHSEHSWQSSILSAVIVAQTSSDAPAVAVVSTYATAQSEEFLKIIDRLPRPSLLVADEVHNVTPDSAEFVLRESYDRRLGLSATPERYMDDVGTDRIISYFRGIVYQFGLKDAIEGGYLTPYRYLPVFCFLTDVETIEYDHITKELKTERTSDESKKSTRITMLLSKRASLIQKAADKLNKFEKAFAESAVDENGFALVYCHPELIDIVQHYIGVDKGIRSHTFTARESQDERSELLRRFGDNDLKVLVAIRCLDEGVDVPATRTAFILNSSANPREFVQRRGRILRNFPGKTESTLYDFIVLPKRASPTDDDLLRRELSRFADFASLALNRQRALAELEQQCTNIGLDPTFYANDL